ncbi:MAG: class I SAM-dependent methyltransferase [Oligoflexia bacterium]|nr:class I SAM-dependent methyltransferase [Oligoflexia bacterium]
MMKKEFDYNEITEDYYDKIYHTDKSVRGFWHWSKFETVKKIITDNNNGTNTKTNTNKKNVLDIGCFSGTFLGTLAESDFSYQLGIDILPKQINFASNKYGTKFRDFIYISDLKDTLGNKYNDFFDVVTIIEVIEHLNAMEISQMLKGAHNLLKSNGELIITTPNYFSIWPLLEFYLNKFSDISYKEQHISKFTFLNFEKKMLFIMSDFQKKFKIELKTTSHLLTPFMAKFNYGLAQKMASIVNAKYWKIFFGPLLVIKLKAIK